MNNIESIINGYQDFQDLHFKENEERFKDLIQNGQKPKALFIGCSDSRVIPEMITSSDPGELFIVRNVGNFVAPFKPDEEYHATASAIEYAVGILGVTDVIICGHSYCGAIESLYKEPIYDIDIIHTMKWLDLGKEAKDYAVSNKPNLPKDELLRYTEKVSVVFQLNNLMTYPIIQKKLNEKKLFIHGWYYDIVHGKISYYDNDEKIFKPLGE
ncbi:MAG: carbonic anhydrase [Sulfurovaceae bacterium]|jgi:carbonic anhydrase|nr:carbonic anhydrase [Sulfurovaceae bacterium]MDD5548936.1 carbonic anhydrase [Sulfurovaceae bacterium]